jgi:hypothetical protein
MARVEDAFSQAVAFNGKEAQAYANMAQYCHNTNQLSRAVEMWTATVERVSNQPDMVKMFTQRRKHSIFGMHSQARDAAYEGGQGNVTEALQHARLQLSVYQSPVIVFDVATMQVMASETAADTPALEAEALQNFQTAGDAAVHSWVVAQTVKGKCPVGGALHTLRSDGPVLEDMAIESVSALDDNGSIKDGANNKHYGGSVSVTWPDGITTERSMTYTEGDAFIATFKQAELSGRDGVITTPRKKKACGVFASSSGPFLNLHENLQLLAVWEGGAVGRQHNGPPWHDAFHGKFGTPWTSGKPVKYTSIASVLQYAAPSFYHLVMEVLPRLLLLRPRLAADPTLKVLVCKDSKSNGFASQFYQLVVGAVLKFGHRNLDSRRHFLPCLCWGDDTMRVI